MGPLLPGNGDTARKREKGMLMIQESSLVHPLAPFRLDVTVWALRRRAINRIDRWDGTTCTRVLVVDQVPVSESLQSISQGVRLSTSDA